MDRCQRSLNLSELPRIRLHIVAGTSNSTTTAAANGTSALEAVPSFETTNLATNVLEVQVHCVHRGAAACRASPADPEDVCTVLVEAPASGSGPACGVVQGTKYMLLLANSTAAAGAGAAAVTARVASDSCDGKYRTM